MKKPKDKLVLRCAVQKPEYGYSHVQFYPMVQRMNGKLEGLGCDDYFEGLYVKDLVISDQIDEKGHGHDANTKDYAWECVFKSYSVRLSDAKGMVKTLSMIERKCNELRERFGYVKNYGEFVCRMANCIGVDVIVFDSERYPGETQELSPGSSVDRVLRLVEQQWRKLAGLPTIEEEREAKAAAESVAAPGEAVAA